MNEFSNLEIAYKVLTILKKYKVITRIELVMKSQVNQSYVTNSIALLREKGYKIETNLGGYGGYEYKGYTKKIEKYERIKKEELKSIMNMYKAGVPIRDLIELTVKTKESIFYNLKKGKIKTDRKISVNKKLLKNLYQEGYSLKEIAELSNNKYSTIQKNIYRYVDADRLKRKVIKCDRY